MDDGRPVLVETGLATEGDDFVATLWSLVESDQLAWIFLTHDDRDHAGNLLRILDAAPQARLVEPPTLDCALSDLRRLDPSLLLSSHGVLAHGRTTTLMAAMIEICTMEPLVAPDQAAFEG